MNSDRYQYLCRSAAAVCLLALTVCLTSCGYHMGSMMHPQIKSIAIAEVRNDTKEPLLTPVLRNQLAGRFQFDNSLVLKSKATADCILYCRVLKVSTVSIREDSADGEETYRPSEFEIKIEAEFSVLIPGKSKPLIPGRKVSASAKYQYNADPNEGKYYGMRQCAYNLANKIVEYTTEAW